MGGSYIAALPLLRSGRTRDVGSIHIVTHNEGPWTRTLSVHGLKPKTMPPLIMPGRDGGVIVSFPLFIFQSLQIARYLYRHRIDIVHANEESVASVWSMACRLSGTKMIWHQHGLPTPSRFIRLMRRYCDKLVAVSNFIDERLTKEGRKADFITLNPFDNSHDASSLRPFNRVKAKNRLGIGKSGVAIAFVGSFNEQKRPSVFISTAHYISQRTQQQTTYFVFGDDRDINVSELKLLADNYDIDIVFMGYREDLGDWLKAVDILLAPAVNEGFGRTLVEAMLSGALVVAAQSGGHSEIITDGENGILSEPDDPKAMGTAVLRVLENPALREAMSKKAFKDASQKYLGKNYLRIFNEIYRAA